MNRVFRNLALLCVVACADGSLPAQAADNRVDGSGRSSGPWQLFIDEHWIAQSRGIITTLHQPTKHADNPIIRGDVPWAINPYCFGSVIYDEEESIYKIWYMSYNYGLPLRDRTPILYATSSDGINWIRPELGVSAFRGSTANNIVLTNYGHHDLYAPSVVKDLGDPDPMRRYKMIWWDFPLGPKEYQDDGMCVGFSPDGIHWTKHPHNPVLSAQKKEQSISDVMSVFYDSRGKKFVAYTKGWADPWPAFRQVVRTESTDFVKWSQPQVVLRHAHDRRDPQSYGMFVSKYESVYVGLLPSYKHPGDETIDIQLAVSHDNRNWSRVADQRTFLPTGPESTWDDGMISVAPLLLQGDRIAIYYGGWDGPHHTGSRSAGIGLATLRKDGFVSLDSGANGGVITTRAMRHASGPLWVNANASRGSIRVEVLSADGRPVEGYAASACEAIRSDSIAHRVAWKTQATLPLGDAPIRLRFVLADASLYSFQAGQRVERAED